MKTTIEINVYGSKRSVNYFNLNLNKKIFLQLRKNFNQATSLLYNNNLPVITLPDLSIFCINSELSEIVIICFDILNYN